MRLRALGLSALLLGVSACPRAPEMPKGPPPEYEEPPAPSWLDGGAPPAPEPPAAVTTEPAPEPAAPPQPAEDAGADDAG